MSGTLDVETTNSQNKWKSLLNSSSSPFTFFSLAINLCCTNNNSLADLIAYLMAQNKRVERLDSHGCLAQAANFGNFEFQAGFVACHCVLSVIN